MDAKEVLEQTKKHHFWILCVVVLITGFVGWYMAVSDLSTKTTAQIQSINSSYQQGNGVAAIPEHPNPAIAAGVPFGEPGFCMAIANIRCESSTSRNIFR